MMHELRIKVRLSAGARTDLQRLNQRARHNPGGREEALLKASLVMLHQLNGHRHPTKPLEFDTKFADLSDCDTTYVGSVANEKPPMRIVSRDIPPSRPGAATMREIVAIGPRHDSQVYRTAGMRLERPVGITLAELRAAAEPSPLTHHRTRSIQTRIMGLAGGTGAELELS